ncbi:MAG: succinyl-diaminopimelate desuccinylase [Pseudomonadota bacterium]
MAELHPAAALARDLIAVRSVTPAPANAFAPLASALGSAGFTVERHTFGPAGAAVENLFAFHKAGDGPHLGLAGHMDVVPPGDESAWGVPPFEARVVDGVLHGRGAQDMKGGVAAMACAAMDWARVATRGTVSLIVTGDEEGPAKHGTKPLVAAIHERFPLDGCVVGEPTSVSQLGDTMKVGRRGSLSATVTVTGKQGHVAYQHRALNPVPTALSVGQALLAPLDEGSASFLPTNLEIVSIDVGNAAWNIIPAEVTIRFNVRFNDLWTAERLRAELSYRVAGASARGAVEVTFEPANDCFLTDDPHLRDAVMDAVAEVTGVRPDANTGGGTSDARFIKDHCPVVEFGGVGDLLHQMDERVSLVELERLTQCYRAIIDRFMAV